MRRTILALSFVALATTAVVWAGGQNKSAPAATEDQALKQAAAAYGAALDKGEIAPIVAMWTNDADYIDDSGTIYKGSEAIGKLFEQCQESLKESKVVYNLTSMRFLKPDVVVTDGEAVLTAPDGTTDRNRFTAIWVKNGPRWQIASARDLPTAEEVVAETQLKDLDWLIGDWQAEENETQVRMNCRWALENKFLRMEFAVASAKDPFTVVQYVGWDPTEGQIHSWTFDSRGGFGESVWTREDGEWVAVTTGVLPSGQTGTATNSFRTVGPNAMVWKSREREVDGRPIPDHEFKYSRIPTKP